MHVLRRDIAWRSLAVAAGIGALLLTGTSGVSAQSMLDPASPTAESLNRLYRIMFYLGVAVFLLVEGLIVFAALRFRRREGDEEPERIHGSTRAEIAWTIAPTIIVLVLAAISYRPLREQYKAPRDALAFEVTDEQRSWESHDPEHDVTTTTEFVVPAGEPVEQWVDGADVIHGFLSPGLGGKIDAIAGNRDARLRPNSLWFQAESACACQYRDLGAGSCALPLDPVLGGR